MASGLDIILLNACDGGHYDICKLAIEKGGNPSYFDKYTSSMVIAFLNDNIDIAHLLANNMSKDDLTRELGICMKAQKKLTKQEEEKKYLPFYYDLFDLLLEHEAKPDGNDEFIVKHGNRPLHYAASFNNLDMCEFLIDYGADPTILDANGKSAHWYATEKDVISYLKDAENEAKEMTGEEKEENIHKRARIET